MMQTCVKGTEINLSTGEVFDKEIRHGIYQLQFALPRLLTQMLSYFAVSKYDDCLAFAFCPILVTNAELFVARGDFDITMVENSSDISDFAERVPYLRLWQGYGSDFEKQCLRDFESIPRFLGTAQLDIFLKNYEKRKDSFPNHSPARFLKSLYQVDRTILQGLFTNIIICNNAQFPSLVDIIMSKITEGLSSI